jgi:hypothetical protein
MKFCACIGPQPGHGLCPCKEKLELERRKVRKQGLPTDLDRPRFTRGRTASVPRCKPSPKGW